MQLMGSAFEDASVRAAADHAPLIGIAPWGSIKFRDKLAGNRGKRVAYPKIGGPLDVPEATPAPRAALDRNHTHFLLAEHGSGHFGDELAFRYALEQSLLQATSVRRVALNKCP